MKTNQTNKHILNLALGLGLAVFEGATSARAADYVFTTIDHPLGIKGTTARGINAAGVVVGDYRDANDIVHGYRLTQGVFEVIDHPGATTTNTWENGTFLIGVNDAGTVLGYYVAADRGRGFMLQNGIYTALDYPLAISAPYGISSTGEVVGFFRNDSGYGVGYRFKDGVFTTIDNPLGADPDCVEYVPNGVNASGVVVGRWDDNCDDPAQNAYLLKDGVYTTINHPDTLVYGASAAGINDSGTVVGNYNSGFTTNGFPIYTGYVLKDGIYDTNIVHPFFPNYNTLPQGINAGGQVVGILQLRSFPTVFHGFIATPVAIPPKELRLSIGQTGDTLQLTATGTTNTNWRLEYHDTLTGTNAWQPLTNITLGDSPFVLDQPLNSSSRFYRGVSLP